MSDYKEKYLKYKYKYNNLIYGGHPARPHRLDTAIKKREKEMQKREKERKNEQNEHRYQAFIAAEGMPYDSDFNTHYIDHKNNDDENMTNHLLYQRITPGQYPRAPSARHYLFSNGESRTYDNRGRDVTNW